MGAKDLQCLAANGALGLGFWGYSWLFGILKIEKFMNQSYTVIFVHVVVNVVCTTDIYQEIPISNRFRSNCDHLALIDDILTAQLGLNSNKLGNFMQLPGPKQELMVFSQLAQSKASQKRCP